VSEEFRARLTEFDGVNLNISLVAIEENLSPVDEGSDQFCSGCWQPRRGMLRANTEKTDSAVTALIGFETLSGQFEAVQVSPDGVFSDSGFDVAPAGGQFGFGGDGFGSGGFGN